MLTPAEIREIEDAIHPYEHRAAGCLDALKIVQAHRRWVSDEAVAGIAALLGMSATEVDSVATFYNLIFRRPVGRHVILVCDSVSCWLMGYENAAAYLQQRLGIDFGETTPDGVFTLLPVPCLGACDRAPAVMIGPDLHGPLDEPTIDRLLDEYRRKDRA